MMVDNRYMNPIIEQLADVTMYIEEATPVEKNETTHKDGNRLGKRKRKTVNGKSEYKNPLPDGAYHCEIAGW